jgi:hypothetical protein
MRRGAARDCHRRSSKIEANLRAECRIVRQTAAPAVNAQIIGCASDRMA